MPEVPVLKAGCGCLKHTGPCAAVVLNRTCAARVQVLSEFVVKHRGIMPGWDIADALQQREQVIQLALAGPPSFLPSTSTCCYSPALLQCARLRTIMHRDPWIELGDCSRACVLRATMLEPRMCESCLCRWPSITSDSQDVFHAPTIDHKTTRAQVRQILFSTWGACVSADPERPNKPFIADAIVANPPCYGHSHCAEALNVPLHIVFTMPWTPTKVNLPTICAGTNSAALRMRAVLRSCLLPAVACNPARTHQPLEPLNCCLAHLDCCPGGSLNSMGRLVV